MTVRQTEKVKTDRDRLAHRQTNDEYGDLRMRRTELWP